MAEATFDHERLDVYRLSINYVAFSYQIAKIAWRNESASTRSMAAGSAIDSAEHCRG